MSDYDSFGGYLTRVRRWLHELDPGTSFWSEELLKDLFNANYRRRSAQLTMAYEGAFVERATRDIVAKQDRYAWPDNFERLIKLEMVYSTGRTVPLQRFERHEGPGYVSSAVTEDLYLPTYRPIGSGFLLEPTPTITVPNGLRLEYVATPPVLSAPDDKLHPDFPKSFSELLVLDTVVNALDTENMIETGNVRTVLRQRTELEMDWLRYIDNRLISKQKTIPFVGYYEDA